jgi:hypothetical protein
MSIPASNIYGTKRLSHSKEARTSARLETRPLPRSISHKHILLSNTLQCNKNNHETGKKSYGNFDYPHINSYLDVTNTFSQVVRAG